MANYAIVLRAHRSQLRFEREAAEKHRQTRSGSGDTNQAPPDLFLFGYVALLAVESTIGKYTGGKEYYYDRGVAVPANDLTLSITDISSMSEAAIDNALTGFHMRFMHDRVVSPTAWSNGGYTPSGATKRLFQLTDPDNHARAVGILLEQSSTNVLSAFTWYKTFVNTGTGQVWNTSPPASSTVSLVRDQSTIPSTSIYDITPKSTTWYHLTQA